MPAPLPPRVLFSLLLCLAAQAATAEAQDELPDDERVKLQALQTEIDKSERERQRQRENLLQLEHQLNCNWTLIRTYELCKQLHTGQPDDLAACTKQARDKARKCLQADAKPSASREE